MNNRWPWKIRRWYVVLGFSSAILMNLCGQRSLSKADSLLFNSVGSYSLAFEELEKSNWEKSVRILKRLGVDLRKAGALQEAQEAFRHAYRIEADQGPISPSTWYNLGLIKMDLEEHDSVLYFLDACEMVSDELNDEKTQGLLHHLRSDFFFGQGQFHEALEDLNLLFEIQTGRGRDLLLGNVIFRQARCHYELGNTEQALDLLDQCLVLAHEFGLGKPGIERVLKLKRVVGGVPGSQEAESNPISLSAAKEFGDYGRYRMLLSKMQKKHMETEMALQKVRLSKQRTMLSILTFAVLLFLSLLFLLWKSNAKVRDQKATILKALEDREILLKEIHHRVKNNLQIISSLLSLQSRTIQDDIAVSALIDGRSRVESMALIHQDLYEEENLTGIQVEGYIEKLCRNLYATYNVKGDRVLLKLHIDPIKLDVNTLIPLGLILNELISNALKYAFPNGRGGELTVTFREENDQLTLEVKDNGVGMLNGSVEGFGQRLIRAFAKKLAAEIKIKEDNGVIIGLRILNYKVA